MSCLGGRPYAFAHALPRAFPTSVARDTCALVYNDWKFRSAYRHCGGARSLICSAYSGSLPKIDLASLSPQEREQLRLKSKAIPLVADTDPIDIIHEDASFLVVSKPGWLKMHPSHRFQGGTLLNRVIGYLGYNPYICHRLDMHTTGVSLFLKKKDLCAPISAAFKEHRIHKEYLCLVDTPMPPPSKFSVNAAIEKHPTLPIARQVGTSSSSAKQALTHFEVISSSPNAELCLLKASPKTGRTHQIRIHASHFGFPIVGDEFYGRERECYDSIEHVRSCASDESKTLFADGNPLRAGLKLHAWKMTLQHPFPNATYNFSAHLPERFVALAKQQGLLLPPDI